MNNYIITLVPEYSGEKVMDAVKDEISDVSVTSK